MLIFSVLLLVIYVVSVLVLNLNAMQAAWVQMRVQMRVRFCRSPQPAGAAIPCGSGSTTPILYGRLKNGNGKAGGHWAWGYSLRAHRRK
jgi:hypothetical protein